MTEFSTEAVRQFIKFLYGFQLGETGEEKCWTDLKFIKELIVLGGVASVSDFQTAAASYLAIHLNANNAMELRDFAADHNAAAARELCKKVLDYAKPPSILVPFVVSNVAKYVHSNSNTTFPYSI